MTLLFARGLRLIGPRLWLLDGGLYRLGCRLYRRLIVARRVVLLILMLNLLRILARMPVAAAAIAAEAGVDDFLAQATPEAKLELI
ncbi:MAG: hypothetical protein PSV22_00845, partial [Pseudolabrys sp.]|nr:hypothetical protein [Pseudolabrys sp.]